MKTRGMILAPVLLAAAAACAGDPVVDPVFIDTTVSELRATASGRDYRILIARPAQPAPAGGYAVLYVLDADIMFGTMVEAARSLSRRPGVRPAAVVGIGYPRGRNVQVERRLDLTPSPTTVAPAGTGGAEAFLRFIREELQPLVATRLPVATDQETLFGHSYGGLFVLYALVNQPTAFDNFVAASPSIWHAERMMQGPNVRGRLAAKLRATQATPRVLITVGEYEQAADPDFARPEADGSDSLAARAQVDNAREFTGWLAGVAGVAAELNVFAGEDHGTVIPAALSRGVRFALSPRATRPLPAPGIPVADPAPGGIAVPTAGEYTGWSAIERYQLRLRVRALPEMAREQWNGLLKERLDAALTYAEHRRLHEERVEQDIVHGTRAPGE